MKRKTKKPRVTKSKRNKNLVLYVENNTSKGKVFSDSKSLKLFVKDFQKKYPPNTEQYPDNWLDAVITDIKGDITVLDDGGLVIE